MGYPVLPWNTSFARNFRRMIPQSILNSMDNTCLERPNHMRAEMSHKPGTCCRYYSLLRHQDLEDAKHGNTICASNYPIKQKACTRLVGERVFSTRRSRDFQRGSDRDNAQQSIPTREGVRTSNKNCVGLQPPHSHKAYFRNQIS